MPGDKQESCSRMIKDRLKTLSLTSKVILRPRKSDSGSWCNDVIIHIILAAGDYRKLILKYRTC